MFVYMRRGCCACEVGLFMVVVGVGYVFGVYLCMLGLLFLC